MQYSPEFVELVASCHEVQTAQLGWAAWERLEAAALVYAKANGIESFNVEQLLIPEQRRNTCPCCGHARYIVRQPGFYFNGKSLQDLLTDEAKKAAASPPSQEIRPTAATAVDAAEWGNGA